MAEKEQGLSSITEKLQEVILKADANTKTLAERFTDGFKENYEKLQKQANVFGNVKESFSNDIGKLGIAFAPLTTLPGVETLLTLLKSLGAKLLLTTLKAFKLQRKTAKEAKLKDRASKLNTGGAVVEGSVGKSPVGKSTFQKIKEGFLFLTLGFVTVLKVFWNGFKVGLLQGLTKMTKFFNLKSLTAGLIIPNLLAKVKLGAALKDFGKKITNFFKPLGKFGKAIEPVTKIAAALLARVGAFGAFLGRLVPWVTLLLGSFEGVKGAIAGFTRFSGENIISQIMGGLTGFLSGVTQFIVGGLLDLLKNIVSGIGTFFSFDTSMLDGFSFTEIIGDYFKNWSDFVADSIQYVTDIFKSIDIGAYFSNLVDRAMNSLKSIFTKMISFPKAVAVGGLAALMSPFSPMKAFNKAFNDSLADSSASINALASQGEQLSQQSDATTEAARDVQFGGRDRDGQTNIVTNNVTNNGGTKKTVVSQQRPLDDFSHRLAYS